MARRRASMFCSLSRWRWPLAAYRSAYSRTYPPGPGAVTSSRLDRGLRSSVQMAPVTVQSTVTGRTTVTAPRESGGAGCPRLRAVAGQGLVVAGVVGEGHPHLDDQALVVGNYRLAGTRSLLDVHAAGDPLVGEDGVFHAVFAGDLRSVDGESFPDLRRSADGRALLRRFLSGGHRQPDQH